MVQMTAIKMTFFFPPIENRGKMISQYNYVEHCQCNSSIRLGAKSGERRSGYILNPKYDIKHRYIRQVNSFCSRTDAGQVRNHRLLGQIKRLQFF